MSEPARFDEHDWQSLSPSEKKTIRLFSERTMGFEALSSLPGVGQKGVDDLIAKGLAIEGETGLLGRTFALTDKGCLAFEWLNGRKITTFPES